MIQRVAINGFGRIGRLVLRALLEDKNHDIQVVVINDLAPAEDNAHLFQYDSVHGRYGGAVDASDAHMTIDGQKILTTSIRDPSQCPWGEHKIDLVFECTGRFTAREDAQMHIQAGAKKVLISAPGKDLDRTIVYGVNHGDLTAEDLLVSNASCTTNCLAPMASILHDLVGIEKGFMTTIHAYTADQRLVDSQHTDMRRARSAALSMIPTSTGAAKAVGLVLPELNGKLDGTAIRVPTPNVSMVDLTFIPKKPTSVDQINQALQQASKGPMAGIIDCVDKPLVSVDFNHSSFSCNFDLTQTVVMDETLVRVVAWYDNEWGFSNRMIDTAQTMLAVK